jgi:uncharacterized protein (DUF433 family)
VPQPTLSRRPGLNRGPRVYEPLLRLVDWYTTGMRADPLSRITHDVAVMGGRPCIRGMRVTVGTILGLMASGKTAEEILALYPYLEGEDIQAALAYAAWRSEEIEVPLKAS